MKHLVPILDEGVSLDRGDHVIVVMDGTAMPDVAATPAGLVKAVEQLLGKLPGPRPAPQTMLKNIKTPDDQAVITEEER